MKADFFFLAGGLGRRTLPLADWRAKPSFPLAGTPLIRRMIEMVLRFGDPVSHGWINLHHRPQSILACLQCNWPISLVYERQLSGSMVLRRALDNQDWTHLLIINGDLFCQIPFSSLLGALGHHDGALLVRQQIEDEPYRNLICHGDRFVQRGEMGAAGWMYGGVCLLARQVVEHIRSDNFFDDFDNQNWDITVCPYEGIWLDFGDPAAYFQANLRFIDHYGLTERDLWCQSADVSALSQISRSILWPRCRLSDQTHLQDCIVCDGAHPPAGTYRREIITRTGVIPF